MRALRTGRATDLGGLLAQHGVHGRRLRRALALLCRDWVAFDDLVRITALPRRTAQELVLALERDLRQDAGRLRIDPARAAEYRRQHGLDVPEPVDPLADAVAARPELLALISQDIAEVPPPLAALDHVQATEETALRRALWLDETYQLAGGRLLCLGDHDLTSLAVCAVNPDVSVTVVDVDDRVLEFVETRAAQRGWDVRTLHADLRFGFPPAALEWADLVFTDPPYTPEGMALFVGTAVRALRDPGQGRVLVAYGYSDRSPALGLKVQQEVQKLGIVFEAILPEFHRYRGAQAVGSASDLYVCRPTARSPKLASPAGGTGIYTHGPQSVEAVGPSKAVLDALCDIAPRPASSPPPKPRRPGWEEPIGRGAASLAVDLSDDPGPWLLRTLLACAAGRMAALVPNNHPDVSSERGQRELLDLVGARFTVRFLRSTPDNRHAVVVAEPVPVAELDEGRTAVREVLLRAHGRLGNIWREALITASRGALTKREARDRLEQAAPNTDDLELRLIDLPRHRLRALIPAIAAS